jgi:hypothetical protein
MLGIHPRKTNNEKFLCVNADLMPHFVRGIFDGDGCIHFGRYLDKRDSKYYNQQSVTIASGCKSFLYDIKNVIQMGNISYQQNNKGSCYRLRLSARDDVVRFGRYIYSSGGFSLTRKYNIFVNGDLL